jgi:hypothetical protein
MNPNDSWREEGVLGLGDTGDDPDIPGDSPAVIVGTGDEHEGLVGVLNIIDWLWR